MVTNPTHARLGHLTCCSLMCSACACMGMPHRPGEQVQPTSIGWKFPPAHCASQQHREESSPNFLHHRSDLLPCWGVQPPACTERCGSWTGCPTLTPHIHAASAKAKVRQTTLCGTRRVLEASLATTPILPDPMSAWPQEWPHMHRRVTPAADPAIIFSCVCLCLVRRLFFCSAGVITFSFSNASACSTWTRLT